MTARILVVDDVAANLKLLDARLTAEYFEVRESVNERVLRRWRFAKTARNAISCFSMS